MGAERGAGSIDRSLNFSGYPQNEENPRISRMAVYHCICTAPYMIRKGRRKGGRTSRTLVGPHNAIYVIWNASNVNFLPNFTLSHQDSYKSGRTPFRPPFPGTRISKNIHTYLSLGSNGLSIELLHTFLAWNSYPHMKISWFQLIMADFDDRSWQKIAIFCHLFNLKQCAVKFEPDELWG